MVSSILVFDRDKIDEKSEKGNGDLGI